MSTSTNTSIFCSLCLIFQDFLTSRSLKLSGVHKWLARCQCKLLELLASKCCLFKNLTFFKNFFHKKHAENLRHPANCLVYRAALHPLRSLCRFVWSCFGHLTRKLNQCLYKRHAFDFATITFNTLECCK